MGQSDKEGSAKRPREELADVDRTCRDCDAAFSVTDNERPRQRCEACRKQRRTELKKTKKLKGEGGTEGCVQEAPATGGPSGLVCICDAIPCYCGAADGSADVSAAVGASQKQSGPKACYNCGEVGHLTADCTAPRTKGMFKGKGRSSKVCYKCQQEGHLSFECTIAKGRVKSKYKNGPHRDFLPLPAKKAAPEEQLP